MHLLWVSDHAPRPSISAITRNLITILPGDRYVYDEATGKVNLTVEAACHAIMSSFNHLSQAGVVLRHPLNHKVAPWFVSSCAVVFFGGRMFGTH